MYGQYSELQRFAREFASRSSFRREIERKPYTIEEAKKRKSRYFRKFCADKVFLLVTILQACEAQFHFTLLFLLQELGSL